MSILLETHPNGTQIYFDEASHKYYTDEIKDFTSATTYIHTFFPEFERDKIAKRYAEKHGLSVNQVLMDWQAKADESIVLGNMVHKFCEEKLLNQEYSILPVTEKQRQVIQVADKCIDKMLQKFEFVASEKIIFSPEYKLAGTIDAIMKYKDKIILFDWKTNKEIKTDNNFNKFGLRCLSHLPDNNYTHYQLQLNLYKWLLLKEGYYDCQIDMRLVHLSTNGVKIYKVKNYQSEISEIMQEKASTM